MYAVIKTGGKQYRVTEGQQLQVEKLGVDEGEVSLTPVLLVDGDTVVSGPDGFEPGQRFRRAAVHADADGRAPAHA